MIRWWDHFQPLKPLYERMFAEYGKAHPGTRVEHVVYNPSEMGQALQLAFKSNQIADVHTVVGLGSSEAALVAGGWFSPLANPDAIRAKLPADSLLEGLHVFDGKLYTSPVFTPRQYATLNWFNRDLVEKVGGDPDAGPATWDEFRALAARITKDGGGRAYGWIQGLQFQERMQTHVTELAMSAGRASCSCPASPSTSKRPPSCWPSAPGPSSTGRWRATWTRCPSTWRPWPRRTCTRRTSGRSSCSAGTSGSRPAPSPATPPSPR
ncbi:extracellular solute-binding protein [Nonomuraea sp. NPDC048882]|uniref:extracellular solute-binding protein n=1 Tax=Nonomuraea sp. NPDC048882 TaxID=3154347 RepID=UPI0033D32E78